MTVLRTITEEQLVQVAVTGLVVAASMAFVAYVWTWIYSKP